MRIAAETEPVSHVPYDPHTYSGNSRIKIITFNSQILINIFINIPESTLCNNITCSTV